MITLQLTLLVKNLDWVFFFVSLLCCGRVILEVCTHTNCLWRLDWPSTFQPPQVALQAPPSVRPSSSPPWGLGAAASHFTNVHSSLQSLTLPR